MFDIGWTEMLVIGAVAILVVGPRELPGMLRTFGKQIGQLRRMASDFQKQLNDALKEAELDEVRRGIESVKSASPAAQLRKEMASFTDAGNSVRKAVEDPGAPAPEKAKTPAEAPATAEQAEPQPAPAARPDPGAEAAATPPDADGKKVATTEPAT